MATIETLLGLLVAAALLTLLARKLRVPYPALLVIGGLGLGFVPGLPRIELPPDLVFLLFLPPLIYFGALTTSLPDLRANLRPIAQLAVGLVLVTIVAVAVAARQVIEGLPWASAFALGAIAAGTDAVAVMAITDCVRLPRRLVAIL